MSPSPQPLSPIRTAFVDRDGVLNRKMPEGQYVTRWEQFEVLPGVVEAVGKLNRAGMRVVVVTNQRGVALGRLTQADLESLHARLATVLQAAGAQVHAILYCPHEKDTCNCRKPLPGMFEQAQRLFPGTEASTSVMIGDSLSDIRFGSNLGMQTIFIQGDPTRQGPGAVEAATLANHRAASLLEAVELLLQG